MLSILITLKQVKKHENIGFPILNENCSSTVKNSDALALKERKKDICSIIFFLFKPERKYRVNIFLLQINPAEINTVISTQVWQGCTTKKKLKTKLRTKYKIFNF